MTKYTIDLVRDSHWLEPDSLDFLDLKESTPMYLTLERIWLNVAASYGLKWQDVENARESEMKRYGVKIITILLTMRTLKVVHKYDENEINLFLGLDNLSLIEEYFEYVDKMKKD